ncbi:MAG: ADP-glyceromanno-heptose 6-epimerase [Ignavibacteria bacterium RBG_16_34_14]|nr:MAG: ADP-glyceromanno-heptose 6-epimerase [Ignavibacteria bacterium RBG_16_34_14]
MIIVTGGAGFIGSAIIWRLNTINFDDIIIVDSLGNEEKWKNLVGLNFRDFIHKDDFINLTETSALEIPTAIIHMGANSSTTEKDADSLLSNNFEYSKKLVEYCLTKEVRFIYASSAATYGDGSLGFDDREADMHLLRPLNMYGYSKMMFDLWALKRGITNKVVGLKYFNVYGPNEYHKGDMRSVVHKAYEQISDTGKTRLFKSADPKYKDGEQMRDFIYIKDAVDMTLFFLEHPDKNGLFNIGSGKARTWNDLVNSLFNAMNKNAEIEYFDMPAHLLEKYQYFTEAKMDKIKKAGYSKPPMSLEDGITDYVQNYLLKEKFLGW